MNYIHRSLERKFMKMCDVFKVVMVTGARQVGKTTMLRHLAEDTGRTFVTMDDADIRELAERDPKLFFQMYRPPILIDEAQKAPQLFEQIKIICDQSDERGRFWLTGSQSRKLMKQAGDSLAGRIGILKMYSLSDKEIAGKADDIDYDWGFNFAGAQQDIHIENNLMFWAFSYDNANGTGGVLIIDLMDESLLSDYIIDLQSTGREVEGIFRDGSLLYVTSHQGGNNNFNLKLHVVDLLQTNLDEE